MPPPPLLLLPLPQENQEVKAKKQAPRPICTRTATPGPPLRGKSGTRQAATAEQ